VVLCGGDKGSQSRDIEKAKTREGSPASPIVRLSAVAAALQPRATMKTQTTPFDAAAYIEGPEGAAAFLASALETGNAGYIQHALGILARAKGMTDISEASGLGRESLYKALKEEAKPQFETVLKVVAALGFRLSVTPADIAA
jgi:probable addiction module antidote protein